MKNIQRNIIFLVILFNSCTSRSIVYFNDIKGNEEYKKFIENNIEPTIQINDLLSITVSSLNPESNILFNSGVLYTSGNAGNTNTITSLNEGYLVDKYGNINFPVIGQINLIGMTKEEVRNKMTEKISEYVKNPIVNIRFLNFKVTVIGEVNNPTTINIPSEKINIIEALGLAGDMTIYGKRENVMIIREKDGLRTTVRLNLNKKEILNSPYFYLQQNDIVYVEPVKTKAAQASGVRNNITFTLSIASLLAFILSQLF